MKLIVAIIKNEDFRNLNEALIDRGFRMTRMASSGGFLGQRNDTIMLGVEDERVEEALEIIKEVCATRLRYVTGRGVGGMIPGSPMVPGGSLPVETTSGGATIFVLDCEQKQQR